MRNKKAETTRDFVQRTGMGAGDAEAHWQGHRGNSGGGRNERKQRRRCRRREGNLQVERLL